jgi:antitoxin MazE3
MHFEYRCGIVACVSTQIAVRLPDEVVTRLDELVANGQAPSRASVIEQALAREFRRLIAIRDAEILARAAQDDDMDALAEHAAHLSLDVA